MYKIEIDENNYLTGNWAQIGGSRDWVDVEKLPEREPFNCNKYENGEYIFDEEKEKSFINDEKIQQKIYEAKNEIDSIKKQLFDTDYQVIKCAEYSQAGLEAPYDVEELHKTRQALRDKINELENELKNNQNQEE